LKGVAYLLETISFYQINSFSLAKNCKIASKIITEKGTGRSFLIEGVVRQMLKARL